MDSILDFYCLNLVFLESKKNDKDKIEKMGNRLYL